MGVIGVCSSVYSKRKVKLELSRQKFSSFIISVSRVWMTLTRTYTRTRAYARIESSVDSKLKHSRWGGGRGGSGIVCPREFCRKNRQEKVGCCKTSSKLFRGNTPVRVIGVGVYRGEVTGNRPRLTDVAMPLCKRLSLSSGVSAILQSHSNRVFIFAAPYRRLSRQRGCFIFGRKVIKQNRTLQGGEIWSVNEIKALAVQNRTNDIKCFSSIKCTHLNI